MKIMFSAGEPSGDVHGASLARAVLERCREAELIGFGGPKMAEAGVRLCSDMREYSIMGVWEVIKNLHRIFALLNKLESFMRQEKPDILVLIDYPDFNWRLAKKAKAMGIPVFSYIPPSAWAWRKGRAKKCAAIADEFAAIFPFELPVYKAAGANISFNGNPLVDTVKPTMTVDEARRYFKVEADKQPVILLPGSRKQEITMLLPTMLAAAELLQQDNGALTFYLPVAPGIDKALIEGIVAHYQVGVHYTTDNNYDLMNSGTFALAASGTVVLEAALLGLPCVCLYRMGRLNYAIGKLLVDIEFFTLPNILAGRQVQRELLQDEVTARNIYEEARRFYADGDYRGRVVAGLNEATATLGGPGAAGRVAEKILAAAERYGKGCREVGN